MAIVKKYLAEVIHIENQIEGIYTIELKSLNGPFKYYPGQFLHLALDKYDPSSVWPDSRCFSMQTSPCEENIRITYAVKGVFTNRMYKEIKPGTNVTLKLPYGEMFIQEHSKDNTVFIAGGTGITPFLSLFTYHAFAEYRSPILYAGFRNKEMNLYYSELGKAFEINPEFKINILYQEKDGILDIQKIYEKEKNNHSYFISGPPSMICNFKTYLIKQEIPEDKIKTDEWN